MSKRSEHTEEGLSLEEQVEWAEWQVEMANANLSDLLAKQRVVSQFKTQTRGELDDALARLVTLTEEEVISSSRQRHRQLVLDEIFHTSGISSTPDGGPELQGYGDKHG